MCSNKSQHVVWFRSYTWLHTCLPVHHLLKVLLGLLELQTSGKGPLGPSVDAYCISQRLQAGINNNAALQKDMHSVATKVPGSLPC